MVKCIECKNLETRKEPVPNLPMIEKHVKRSPPEKGHSYFCNAKKKLLHVNWEVSKDRPCPDFQARIKFSDSQS